MKNVFQDMHNWLKNIFHFKSITSNLETRFGRFLISFFKDRFEDEQL